jgi:hypothetical protein
LNIGSNSNILGDVHNVGLILYSLNEFELVAGELSIRSTWNSDREGDIDVGMWGILSEDIKGHSETSNRHIGEILKEDLP